MCYLEIWAREYSFTQCIHLFTFEFFFFYMKNVFKIYKVRHFSCFHAEGKLHLIEGKLHLWHTHRHTHTHTHTHYFRGKKLISVASEASYVNLVFSYNIQGSTYFRELIETVTAKNNHGNYGNYSETVVLWSF